ncbi:MAG: hypothetical protein GXP32_04660, partial [Kiritimatiellaeota bacterium]|nr:hypothetical protein [Kiritimatiellota bacterium]
MKAFISIEGKRLEGARSMVQAGIQPLMKAVNKRSKGGRRYEMSIKNIGTKKLLIEQAGLVFLPPAKKKNRQWRVFIDRGECGWCGVKELDALELNTHLRPVMGQRVSEDAEDTLPFHRSSLQSVIWDMKSRQSLLIGFLRQRHGENMVDIVPDENRKDILKIEALQTFEVEIAPNEVLHLDPIIISKGKDPYVLLEQFGDLAQQYHGRVFNEPPIVGMMTWYGYRTAIDEDIILENTRLIKDIFDGYPQETNKIML